MTYSENQSQVLRTLKDLADEKLLKTKDEILKSVEGVKKEGNIALESLITQLSCLAEASRDQKILCILNSLDFETRQSRQSDISGTEQRTFEWIFQDYHGPTNQRVGFREWLRSGNDIYWISGKAGSGKSVLMNYIAHEQFTQDMLQSWAGTTRLVVAKHFFWNAGAPMQKSQQGLLQSLLREMCGQCLELVPIVCPFRWKRYHEIGATWTRLELLEAFKKLSEQRSLSLKFCFFVDGVDEYDGEDKTDIINVLKSLNASPSVKICLSSRPWNIFVSADIHQRLLLEDHNEYDIQQYVKNKFKEDEQFAILQSGEPRSSDLVDQIVQNAQGVFLWVRIVVNNLLRGMSNGDSLSDLQKRLESLPTTLTAYFQHMFDNIDEFYREETAEILLICLEGIQPLSLLALWFYEQERVTPNYALQANKTPFVRADVVAIFESTRKRLNARGQDLLEIEVDTTTVEDLMYTVRFSHLTVKDFLSKPDMLKKLHSWKSKNFDAKISLCRATLAIVKSINLPPLTDKDVYAWTPVVTNHAGNPVISDSARANRCWNYVSEFFSYAHLIEQDEGRLDDALIDELRSVISSFLVRKGHRQGTFLDYLAWAIDHWACWIDQHDILPLRDARNKSLSPYDRDMTSFFFESAVEANLKNYVAHKLTASPHLISRSFWQRPVLDRALRPSPWTKRTYRVDRDMIDLLLTQRVRPSPLTEPTDRLDPDMIDLLLTRVARPSPCTKPTYRIDPNMIDLLLTRGANPNMTLTLRNTTFGSSPRSTSRKAWTTVWGLFLQSLHDSERAEIRKPPELIQDDFEATKLMIEHGAAADLRPWGISASEDPLKPFGSPMLTPSDIFHEVFPPRNAVFLEQLLKKHRGWVLRQACSWVGRTVLLWFYRDIDILMWSLTLLLSFLFGTFGVIFSIIFPTSLYGLSLVWPATWFTVSGIAPILLPALILSDSIPIPDWLVSCLIGVVPRFILLITFNDSRFGHTLRLLWIGGSAEMAFEDPEEPTPNPTPTVSGLSFTLPHCAAYHYCSLIHSDHGSDNVKQNDNGSDDGHK